MQSNMKSQRRVLSGNAALFFLIALTLLIVAGKRLSVPIESKLPPGVTPAGICASFCRTFDQCVVKTAGREAVDRSRDLLESGCLAGCTKHALPVYDCMNRAGMDCKRLGECLLQNPNR